MLLTLERYLSIRVTKWRNGYFTPKKALIASISSGTILLLLHFHSVITNGNSELLNGTEIVICYESFDGSRVWLMWLEVNFSICIITYFYLHYKYYFQIHSIEVNDGSTMIYIKKGFQQLVSLKTGIRS